MNKFYLGAILISAFVLSNILIACAQDDNTIEGVYLKSAGIIHDDFNDDDDELGNGKNEEFLNEEDDNSSNNAEPNNDDDNDADADADNDNDNDEDQHDEEEEDNNSAEQDETSNSIETQETSNVLNEETFRKGGKLEDSAENSMSFVKLFTGKYYEGPYNTINEYLIKNVDRESDLKANMEAAQNLLETEEKKFFKGIKKGLIDALKQLLSLGQILSEENKCSRRSYGALVKNDHATKGKAHNCPSKVGPLRRIDWIVNQFESRHAIECYQTYPISFNAKREQLAENESIKRVELFTTNLIQKRRGKILFLFHRKETKDPMKLIPTGKKIKKIKGKDLAESIYKTIEYLAKDDKNVKYLKKVPDEKKNKMVIDKKRFEELLFEEYISKPCEFYIEQFGPDIFLPSKFDSAMLEKEDRYQLNEVGEFFLGYIRFRLCNTLLTKDKKSIIKEIIKYANKQKQQ